MIHYQLCCAEGHNFDGWFRNSAAFDDQATRSLIACPACASTDVRRALMAPSLTRTRAEPPATVTAEPQAIVPAPMVNLPGLSMPVAGSAMPDQVRAMLHRVRAEIEAKCENVGEHFADEARSIHRGDSEARGIYGEATPEQAESLADEGIDIAAIPWIPRADS